jgi:hypothetical protein
MAEKIEKLTYDSFMPLYHQLKEIFLEKIETEELTEGDRSPLKTNSSKSTMSAGLPSGTPSSF